MMYAALIAAAIAVVALVIFALRAQGWAFDLGKSEGDRDRLEAELYELAAAHSDDATHTKERITQLLAEQEVLRAEIRRRRRPGDARNRLRLLSKAEGEAPGPDRQDNP